MPEITKIELMLLVESKDYDTLAEKLIELGDVEMLAFIISWIDRYARYEGGLEFLKRWL